MLNPIVLEKIMYKKLSIMNQQLRGECNFILRKTEPHGRLREFFEKEWDLDHRWS